MNLNPTNKDTFKAWLVDASGNIAVSRAGVAFLDSQITDMESKCLDEESAAGAAESESVETAPNGDNNLKLGRSIGPLFEEQES